MEEKERADRKLAAEEAARERKLERRREKEAHREAIRQARRKAMLEERAQLYGAVTDNERDFHEIRG